MNTLRKGLLILLLLVLTIPGTVQAQDEDYSNYPGFVNFDELEGFKRTDQSVEIFIKKPLLSLVAAMSEEEDPALTELISNLALIRVEQFSLEPGETEMVQNVVKNVVKKLEKNKWEKLVRARDKKEQVEIFIKSEDATINGLLVMAINGEKEAAFINIVGKIDLKLLSKLGAKFNIEPLKDINPGDSDSDKDKGEEE